METTSIYLLKANVMLALFAAAYYGLLRQLTFFGLNRAYLLLALLFAAVYPALPVPALLPPIVLPLLPAGPTGPAVGAASLAQPTSLLPGLPALGIGLYAVGTGFLLLRLLGQLLSLALVRRRARLAMVLGQAVRLVAGAGGPFSFAGTIYLSEAALRATASLPAVLRHEQAHVQQYHTLDVLLAQVAVALAWLNPAAWLLRRAVLDNLEFLADRAALQTGLSRYAYQYSLLHQQPSGVPAPALAFHFSFSTLKNRIAMLNQPASSSRQLRRYLLAAPLIMALALGYSGAHAQTVVAAAPQRAVPADIVYYLDGEPSNEAAVSALGKDDIASVDFINDPARMKRVFNATGSGVSVVTTKAKVDAPAVLALVEKADLASGYTHTPAAVNAVVPKALAYITSHYPSARLSGEVNELKKKSTGAVKYQVQLITGKRPFYVYFTPQGEFAGE